MLPTCIRIQLGYVHRPCVCTCILMPRNLYSTLFCFSFFSPYFSVCVFLCPLHAKLGFYLPILLFCHEHAYNMTIHWCIGVVMKWGKWGMVCIHMNMHLTFALMMDMNKFGWIICFDVGISITCLFDANMPTFLPYMFAALSR